MGWPGLPFGTPVPASLEQGMVEEDLMVEEVEQGGLVEEHEQGGLVEEAPRCYSTGWSKRMLWCYPTGWTGRRGRPGVIPRRGFTGRSVRHSDAIWRMGLCPKGQGGAAGVSGAVLTGLQGALEEPWGRPVGGCVGGLLPARGRSTG